VSYVVVEDVAASWEHYRRVADALAGPPPSGLIVHAAGPTDEGFRIVGVWESEQAWRSFSERLADAGAPAPLQVLRSLQPQHVVLGGRGGR
jgi:hypothetical protein